MRPFALFDPGSGSSGQKSVQIHGIRIRDTNCNLGFIWLSLTFFFVRFLSHTLSVVHSSPVISCRTWRFSLLYLSHPGQKNVPLPPFLSRDFFPEAWQEKVENTATNCPVQWRGTREGERSTFPSILPRFSP